MSDFLQLTDSSVLLPRQFSSSLFARQDSAADQLLYKSNPVLTNQQALMRQSSIDAIFAPFHQTGNIFCSPYMAADSMIQSSIDEASTDNTYKPHINQYPYMRHAFPRTFSTEDAMQHTQEPMLPHHLLNNQPMYSASSASTSSTSSPNHDYDTSNDATRKDDHLNQFSALISREYTATNQLPQFPQPNARYQFNCEPDTSELDDSELEFSPIATQRQVWSTPSHRRTIAEGNSSFRQSSASGDLAFTAQQQAMIQAWSNQQAQLVQLPPSMPVPIRNLPDSTMGASSHLSKGANSSASPQIKTENPSSSNERRPSLPFPTHSRPPLNKSNSYSVSLPPGVDPNEIVVGTYTRAERAEKIARYREKRARRKWTKKIMYDCRKSFADNRPRVGGRFIKMKN